MINEVINHEIDYSKREIAFNKKQLKSHNKFMLINSALILLMIFVGTYFHSFNWLNGSAIGINFCGLLSHYLEKECNKIEIHFHKRRIEYFDRIKEIYEKKP